MSITQKVVSASLPACCSGILFSIFLSQQPCGTIQTIVPCESAITYTLLYLAAAPIVTAYLHRRYQAKRSGLAIAVSFVTWAYILMNTLSPSPAQAALNALTVVFAYIGTCLLAEMILDC